MCKVIGIQDRLVAAKDWEEECFMGEISFWTGSGMLELGPGEGLTSTLYEQVQMVYTLQHDYFYFKKDRSPPGLCQLLSVGAIEHQDQGDL